MVDALTSIGVLVSQSEQVDIIVEGLPTEYETMVSYISNKSKPMFVDDVESLLLAHESRLDKLRKKSLGAVNLTKCNPNSTTNFQSRISVRVNSNPLAHLTQASNDAANNYNSYNNSSRGGGWNFYCDDRGGSCCHGGGRGKFAYAHCQVCHKFGHEASFFCHRYDENNL